MATHAKNKTKRTPKSQKLQNVLENPEVKEILAKLGEAVQQADMHQWVIGDYMVALVDRFKLSVQQVIRVLPETGLNSNYLYDYYNTAKAVKQPTDRDKADWSVFNGARVGFEKMPKKMREQTSVVSTAERMVREDIPARKVRAKLAAEARHEKDQENAAVVVNDAGEFLRSRCFNADCREVIKGIEDNSVDLIWADVPYSNYDKNEKTGELVVAGSYADEQRTECDNNTKQEAQKLCIDLLELALPKLKENCGMAMWSAGGKPDNWHVLKAAEALGWDCPMAIVWDKGIPQPGSLEELWGISSERVLIFCRRGETLKDRSLVLGGRQDVIDDERLEEYFEKLRFRLKGKQYRPISRENARLMKNGQRPIAYGHIMEKPDSVNKLFVNKMTNTGGLVLDVCGCTGSMCCAAIEMGRDFRYIESNQTNFDNGYARLRTALGVQELKAAAA